MADDVRAHSALRQQVEDLGATVREHAGRARLVAPHTIETESGLRLEGDRIILCTGGTSRRLAVPGSELTATHSDAWSLTVVPASMLLIGACATWAQAASILTAFASLCQLLQTCP